MEDRWKVILGKIEIVKENIINIRADAIVNAANTELFQGGGVCGAIFAAAGADMLAKACDQIGHCDVGKAVITPAFAHKNSKYIIHAVGPRWNGGDSGEAELLYNAYQSALNCAYVNNCKSIAFPLISSGIFGYPHQKAWEQAMKACVDFLADHYSNDFTIIFSVLRDEIVDEGQRILEQVLRDEKIFVACKPESFLCSDLNRNVDAFMRETILLLKVIYEDAELRDVAINHKPDKNNIHEPVFRRLECSFNKVWDIILEGSFEELINTKNMHNKILPDNYEQAEKMVKSFSKLQILALFTCMMRHVSYCARASEEYIFIPWLIGKGLLIPLFEAYLMDKE